MNEYRAAMEHFDLSPEVDAGIRDRLTAPYPAPVPKRKAKPLHLLLAATLILCLLAGTAWAAWRQLKLSYRDVSALYDSPSSVRVLITMEDPEPLVFPHVYPQWLPAGFEESFVSWRLYKAQTLRFENEAGDQLDFHYAAVQLENNQRLVQGKHLQVTETCVNGQSALLIVDKGAAVTTQSLIWADSEAGIVFQLDYEGDGRIPLRRIARNITEVSEADAPIPSHQTKLEEAYKQLGHYELGTLPEDYRLIELYGQGQGYEGGLICVDKRYENESFDSLRFIVQRLPYCQPGESPPADYDMDAALLQTVDPSPSETAPLPGQPVSVKTALTVQGCPALLTEWPGKDNRFLCLTWVDLERDNQFSLEASALSAEELIALAEAIVLLPPS